MNILCVLYFDILLTHVISRNFFSFSIVSLRYQDYIYCSIMYIEMIRNLYLISTV